MKAVLCPVCKGSGVIPPKYSDYYEVSCHGCAEWGSKGWLLIPDVEDLPMPYGDGLSIPVTSDATYYPYVPVTLTNTV